MAGFTLPKALALAAAGAVFVAADMAPMAADSHDGHDHGDMDHGAHNAELMEIGFKAMWGKDYVPGETGGADAVAEDLEGGGKMVADAVACAEACAAELECNGASFYEDPMALYNTDKNCWLKKFADVCAVPVADEPTAVLLLEPTAECAMAPAPADVMVEETPIVAAAAPVGAATVDTAMAPVEASTRDLDLTEDTGASVTVRGAVAAIAVAGAILAMA